MPGQHSQPTLTSMGHRCMCVLLLPAVCTFGKMLGSFTCYCPNTGVEWNRYWNKSQHRKLTREKKILQVIKLIVVCIFGFLLLWKHKAWNRYRNKSQCTKLTREEKIFQVIKLIVVCIFAFLLLWKHKAWNRHWNKSQHRKLTQEKNILQGIKLITFWSQVWRSTTELHPNSIK